MNKWEIFMQGFFSAFNSYALFISVFGDYRVKLITGAEWVLSEHSGWKFVLISLFLVGLVCSIYSVWKGQVNKIMILSFLIALGVIAFPLFITIILGSIAKNFTEDYTLFGIDFMDSDDILAVLYVSGLFEMTFLVIWGVTYLITKGLS